MTSARQIEANRRNAQLSTGPRTDAGKSRSRRNAVRHGLTAETVIDALEDADDYAAFELAVTSDYEARTAVERELVLRLASLLWRLRRATAIETGLFNAQAKHLLKFRERGQTRQASADILNQMHWAALTDPTEPSIQDSTSEDALDLTSRHQLQSNDVTKAFESLSNLPNCLLDRLSRYEATL
jgi:hypothetical protein